MNKGIQITWLNRMAQLQSLARDENLFGKTRRKTICLNTSIRQSISIRNFKFWVSFVKVSKQKSKTSETSNAKALRKHPSKSL